MALGSAVVLVTRLSVTPVRRRIAVGVIWHEVESLEFCENQAIAVRIVVITWLQATDTTSLRQERVTLL
jgi:hypothetical protein